MSEKKALFSIFVYVRWMNLSNFSLFSNPLQFQVTVLIVTWSFFLTLFKRNFQFIFFTFVFQLLLWCDFTLLITTTQSDFPRKFHFFFDVFFFRVRILYFSLVFLIQYLAACCVLLIKCFFFAVSSCCATVVFGNSPVSLVFCDGILAVPVVSFIRCCPPVVCVALNFFFFLSHFVFSFFEAIVFMVAFTCLVPLVAVAAV